MRPSRAAGAHPSPSRLSPSEPRRSRRAGALRRAAAAAFVLLAGALAALPPGTAHAQTDTTLVSNLNQVSAGTTGTVHSTSRQAQGFTTGGSEGRYAFSGVTADVSGFSIGVQPTVSIYTVSGGNPGTLVYTLTNPASFGTGENTWTAPTNATLAAQTSYFVVFEAQSTLPFALRQTAFNNEDTGGAAGWSIENNRRFLLGVPSLGNTWTTTSSKLKIAIKGSFLGLRPGQVKGVMVDQVTHNSVRVRWTKPSESSTAPISRYTIWTRTRNAAGTGWIVNDATTGADANGWIRRGDARPGSATSHTLTGLPSGVLQEVRLSARADRAGESTLYGDNSAAVQFTTTAADLPGAPAAPTVSATADSHTSLDVSWSAPTNTGPAITGYDLQYRAGTSGSFTAGPQDVTGTSTTIGSLEEGTSYQVQVRATNTIGDGGWSPSGTGLTSGQAHMAPAAPATPRVSHITETRAQIGWSEPGDTGTTAIDDYDVQVRRAGASAWGTSVPAVGSKLDPARIALTGYDPDGSGPKSAVDLLPGTRYEVRVRANNRQGTAVRRGAWSPAASFTTRGTPDTAAPSLVSATVNGATLVLTYNEALDPNSVPDSGNAWGVRVAGLLVGARNNVAISGRKVTLTLASAVTRGQTVTITYDTSIAGTNPIQDLAGNDAATFLTARAVTNNTPEPDTTAPSLVSATVNGATLVLTYDEALDPNSVPDSGNAWGVRVAGLLVGARNNVAISGRKVTLTLASAVTRGQTVTITYDTSIAGTNPIQDLAGNDAATFLTARAVTNNTPEPDTTAPSLVSATVNGATLVLTYNEALDPNSVPDSGNAWGVRVAGLLVGARNNVAISGRKVTLTLASAVTRGQTVTITYDTSIAGTNPIQDLAGNDAATFLTARAVTNNTPEPDTTAPSLVSATVNGATLVLTYNEALDPNSVPDSGNAWGVRVAGLLVGARNNVAISGRKVTLTLASAVTRGQTVTITYDTSIAGTNPIQDLAGNDAATFLTARAVTNNTPEVGQVGGVRATMGVGVLSVRWDPVTGATGYKVQWKSEDDSDYDPMNRQTQVTGTNHTIPLTAGTEYTVRVIAILSGGDGPPSAEARATADANSAPAFGQASYRFDAGRERRRQHDRRRGGHGLGERPGCRRHGELFDRGGRHRRRVRDRRRRGPHLHRQRREPRDHPELHPDGAGERRQRARRRDGDCHRDRYRRAARRAGGADLRDDDRDHRGGELAGAQEPRAGH